MKSIRTLLLPAITFACAVCVAYIALPAAFAQTVPPDTATTATGAAVIDTAAAVATPFIVSFAQAHPWVLTLLAVIATLRLVFKPVISIVEAYVRNTPQKTDDAVLENVQHSAAFKAFAWLIDYLGSIKVGPQFTAKPPTATTPTAPVDPAAN